MSTFRSGWAKSKRPDLPCYAPGPERLLSLKEPPSLHVNDVVALANRASSFEFPSGPCAGAPPGAKWESCTYPIFAGSVSRTPQVLSLHPRTSERYPLPQPLHQVPTSRAQSFPSLGQVSSCAGARPASVAGSYDAGASSLPPLQSRGMRRRLSREVLATPGAEGAPPGPAPELRAPFPTRCPGSARSPGLCGALWASAKVALPFWRLGQGSFSPPRAH